MTQNKESLVVILGFLFSCSLNISSILTFSIDSLWVLLYYNDSLLPVSVLHREGCVRPPPPAGTPLPPAPPYATQFVSLSCPRPCCHLWGWHHAGNDRTPLVTAMYCHLHSYSKLWQTNKSLTIFIMYVPMMSQKWRDQLLTGRKFLLGLPYDQGLI